MTDTTDTTDPLIPLTIEPQHNPRRKTVLIAGVPIGTIEQVAEGYAAIVRGRILATMTTPQLACAVIVEAYATSS
jgi:hypothetical protein